MLLSILAMIHKTLLGLIVFSLLSYIIRAENDEKKTAHTTKSEEE